MAGDIHSLTFARLNKLGRLHIPNATYQKPKVIGLLVLEKISKGIYGHGGLSLLRDQDHLNQRGRLSIGVSMWNQSVIGFRDVRKYLQTTDDVYY